MAETNDAIKSGRAGTTPPNCVQDHLKSLNPCRSWGGGPPRMPSPLATCPPKTLMTLATPLNDAR